VSKYKVGDVLELAEDLGWGFPAGEYTLIDLDYNYVPGCFRLLHEDGGEITCHVDFIEQQAELASKRKLWLLGHGVDLPGVTAETPKTCTHEWKQYVGLMERYEYCAHCDEKKKEN
jgi:hypothetical protein